MSNDDSNKNMKGLINSAGKGYPTPKSECFDKTFCERDIPPAFATPLPLHTDTSSPLRHCFQYILKSYYQETAWEAKRYRQTFADLSDVFGMPQVHDHGT